MSNHRQISPLLKSRARALREQSTTAERRLWRFLRRHNLGVKFRRQVPLDRYIVDFVCFDPRIAIEVDGGQHAECDRDRERDAFLSGQGFVVLRFWNPEVMENLDGVLEKILRTLARSSE